MHSAHMILIPTVGYLTLPLESANVLSTVFVEIFARINFRAHEKKNFKNSVLNFVQIELLCENAQKFVLAKISENKVISLSLKNINFDTC